MKEVEKFKVKWSANSAHGPSDVFDIFDTKEGASEFRQKLFDANSILRNSPMDIRIEKILVKVAIPAPEPTPEPAPAVEPATSEQ